MKQIFSVAQDVLQLDWVMQKKHAVSVNHAHASNSITSNYLLLSLSTPPHPTPPSPSQPHKMSLRHLPRLSRRLLSTNPQKRCRGKSDVEAAARAREKHEMAVRNAQWVSSWMMPWERAQMDIPTRPLFFWERVYWRLFFVLGGVGLVYETWVLGNTREWGRVKEGGREGEGLYRKSGALKSTRLLSDEEIERGLAREEV